MGIFEKKDFELNADAGGPAGAQQLAALKKKYQSALDAMYAQKVQVKSVQVEGGKLVVRGEAPSADAKNKVWDAIKMVDATHADLVADINAPAGGVGGPAGAASAPRSYTVQKGDTLSKISKQYYGDANKYMKIFEANKDKLKDPDKIQVGQVLVIP
jgi:nucleoid-associated protein YgaU